MKTAFWASYFPIIQGHVDNSTIFLGDTTSAVNSAALPTQYLRNSPTYPGAIHPSVKGVIEQGYNDAIALLEALGQFGGGGGGGGGGIKRNTALLAFMFVMTDNATHVPRAGFTVTATRSLDGAGFAGCANAVGQVANGVYKINLAAADTNAGVVCFRFTAPGADDLNIVLITTP